MLTLDPALFPKLNTRKALVIVDAQNDFLSPDGALSVTWPNNLVEHISDLVKTFRPYGDVIWVRSLYEDSRDPEDESILTSDAPMIGGRRAVVRGRRPQANPHDQPASNCPEAFLTAGGQDRPRCVRKGTAGAELPDALKEIAEKKDMSVIKTHYSAFRSEELLQRLRMKFVTEIFLCGSLTNIGIQASAMDAAGHGLDITIIEDCCGRRNSMRHSNALKHIVQTTGCEVISAKDVVEKVRPKEVAAKKEMTTRAPRTPAPALAAELSSFANASIDDLLPSESVQGHANHPSKGSSAPSRLSPDAKAENKPKAIDSDKPQGATPGKRGKVQTQATRSRNSEKTLEDAMQSLTMGNTTRGNGIKSGEVQINDTGNMEKVGPRTKFNPDRPEEEDKTLPTDVNSPSSPRAMKNSAHQGSPAGDEITEARPEQVLNGSVSDPYCEGDTRIHYNVLPDDLVAGIFDKLRDEVQWLRMSHQGGEVPRLVAVQGEVGKDGEVPIYRHPADESPPLLPWTSTVKQIKDVVENKVGHPLNHALIQFYRDGNDYISEHSDKTLDIAKGSYIVNVSLGAERTMIFRTKRQPKAKVTTTETATPESTANGTKRTAQRAQLPHNSMCQMGLQTNMRWLHAIRQDKRLDREKTPEELAFGGARISLTFRRIETFLKEEDDDEDEDDHREKNNKKKKHMIWGQGATGKTREEARPVTNGASPEAIQMLQAFGRENQESNFDWGAHYGAGFDVLHISASPRLFTSSDAVANLRVQIMLAEYGLGFAKGSLAPVSTAKDSSSSSAAAAAASASAGVGVIRDRKEEKEEEEEETDRQPIKLVDTDEAKSVVQGDVAIMLYVHQLHANKGKPESSSAAGSARVFTRFQQALDLLGKKRRVGRGSSAGGPLLHTKHLDVWETYAAESEFIAGPSMSLADFAFWPVLHEIKQAGARDGGGGGGGGGDADADADPLAGFTRLGEYYQRIKERDSVQKALGAPVSRSQQKKES